MSDTAQGAPRRAKVAVLVGTLEVGGAERDIVRNFPKLNRDEFEVVVLEFNHAGPLGDVLADEGIRVVSRRSAEEYAKHPTPRGLWELGERLASLAWVVRMLRSERPDVTHSVLPHAYVYQVVGSMLAGSKAKLVMSRLSQSFYADSQRFIHGLERAFLHKRLDAAVCNAAPIRDELIAESVDAGRVHVIHNGIDVSQFSRGDGDRERARDALDMDHDDLIFLAVGNLHTYKGHRELIEASAAAREELPPRWRLLVVGRDEEDNRADYEQLVAELGLGGHVELLGPRDDVALLLLAADVFVQPSHHEGLPNAVIEAMAASLPVIGTAVGGIPELVTQGETGLLVPAKDVPALAEAMVGLAADVERRGALGRAAGERAAAEFSVERSVREYESLYRGLLA